MKDLLDHSRGVYIRPDAPQLAARCRGIDPRSDVAIG